MIHFSFFITKYIYKREREYKIYIYTYKKEREYKIYKKERENIKYIIL